MTHEEQKGIADFTRKYVKLLADFSVLQGMLDDYEKNAMVPVNWQQLWSRRQKSDEYKEALAYFEGWLPAIGKAKSENDLIQQLYQGSIVKPPN